MRNGISVIRKQRRIEMAKKEQELKLFVTKETYDKLLTYADPTVPTLQQTNYYFDLPDFYMGKNGVMLRVREENGEWILCVKIKQKSESPALSSIEIEKPITQEIFEKGKQNPEVLVDLLPTEGQNAIRRLTEPSRLIIRGTLRNERRTLKLLEGYTFELDRTFLPGNQEEYELEVEGMESEAACQQIMEQLTSLGYIFSINKKSKYQRLQEAMDRLDER
jgi:uncharacterized protein YjbK